MKEKLKYVSNNMKSYRARLGYSQEDMAEFLGITRATYCDYEVNPQKVKIEVFENMSNILGCTLADFFKETNVTNSDLASKDKE